MECELIAIHKSRIGLTYRATENICGYLFILPNLLGFIIFTLFGAIFSFGVSFTNWNLLKGLDKADFVGVKNYTRIFSDSNFWASLQNNAILLLVVPISIIFAIFFAAILNQAVYGKSGARALYFLPYVTNVVAVSTVWRALFHPTKGPINMLLLTLGVPEASLPGWLSMSSTFILSILIIVVWQNLGYYILMYSGGLQNISDDLYEAASIDGANAFQKLVSITIPMLSPITFLVAILGVISSLQMWQIVQVLTPNGAGFGKASYTLSFYIYNSAFVKHNNGYSAALSWILLLFTLIITLIQWVGQKKWVNY
jgi:multiple sugar transport system permease protein